MSILGLFLAVAFFVFSCLGTAFSIWGSTQNGMGGEVGDENGNALQRLRATYDTVVVALWFAKEMSKVLLVISMVLVAVSWTYDIAAMAAFVSSTLVGVGVFFLLALLEVIARIMALKFYEPICRVFSLPALYLSLVLRPFVMVSNRFSDAVARWLGVDPTRFNLFVLEELRATAGLSGEESSIEQDAKDMTHSISEFSDRIVREIMTHRTQAVCISADSTVAEAITLIMEKGHSRIPVYQERIDNILGIVYAKDLLGVSQASQTSVRKFMREVLFIPETKSIEELLHQMKQSKVHIAIVVDEYGGMSGIATLEDIIEEIIGDIQDEYEKDAPSEFVRVSDRHAIVDARMNIHDLAQRFKVDFPSSEDYDTIGGFVLSQLGKFPAKGQVITYGNLAIKVTGLSNRRILKLDIRKPNG